MTHKHGGNMLREFFDQHGIVGLWVIERLGLNTMSLQRFPTPEDTALAVATLLHEVGGKLSKFKFTSDNVLDFDYLKNECGILHRHLGRQIGYTVSAKLSWHVKSGLTDAEKATLTASLKQTAIACKRFKLPSELIKKAA